MSSKIKIKMGLIEIEYEGSEEFLKEELPALLEAVSDLHNKSAPLIPEAPIVSNTSDTSIDNIQGTTGTIASKVGGASGPDLAVAAAARITFVLKAETFHRKKLLEEMKAASAYYKPSYLSNLTKILNGLVKEGKFMESAKDTYSLSADCRKNLEAQLA